MCQREGDAAQRAPGETRIALLIKRTGYGRMGAAPMRGEGLRHRPRLGHCRRREERAKVASQFLAPARADHPDEVSRVVNLTPLPPRALEVPRDRRTQS